MPVGVKLHDLMHGARKSWPYGVLMYIDHHCLSRRSSLGQHIQCSCKSYVTMPYIPVALDKCLCSHIQCNHSSVRVRYKVFTMSIWCGFSCDTLHHVMDRCSESVQALCACMHFSSPHTGRRRTCHRRWRWRNSTRCSFSHCCC